MKNPYLFLCLVLLSMTGCDEEQPVAPVQHQPGEAKRDIVDMHSDYRHQVFYSLGEAKEVSRNAKYDWDLGLSAQGGQIICNTSKGMFVAQTTATSFAAITDTAGLKFQCDASSRHADSTAIGQWHDNNYLGTGKIYVVNLGFDSKGDGLGFKKLKLDKLEANTLHFTVADLSATQGQSFTIARDAALQYSCFTLAGNQSSIEPPSADWDICFTQYLHVFEETGPYMVTGVLSNISRWETAELETDTFADIDLATAQALSFSANADQIGYDWKNYSLDTHTFSMNLKKCFVLKNTEGVYYKLRFLDFYGEKGEKGKPSFEFQRL